MTTEYRISQSDKRFPVMQGEGDNWAVAIADDTGTIKALLAPNERTQAAAQALSEYLEKEVGTKIVPRGEWRQA